MNPRPTAPKAVALAKLRYTPVYCHVRIRAVPFSSNHFMCRLGFMEERPFAPSARGLRRARERGEGPRSLLLQSVVVVAFGLLGLALLGRALIGHLMAWLSCGVHDVTTPWRACLREWMLLLLMPWFGALLVGVVQTGGWISWRRFKLGWRCLSPRCSWGDVVFMLLTGAALGVPLIWLWFSCRSFSLRALWPRLYGLAVMSTLAIALVAWLDWRYRHRQFVQRLHQTAQEKKEEQRESEGRERPFKKK